MRIRFPVVLTVVIAFLCLGENASGRCGWPPHLVPPGSDTPLPPHPNEDPVVRYARLYDAILKGHGVGRGQAQRIAGKQGEPDVRFALLYESYLDVIKRAKYHEENAPIILEGLRAAGVHLGNIIKIAPDGSQDFALGRDDLHSLANMTRKLQARYKEFQEELKRLEGRLDAAARTDCTAYDVSIRIVAATYGENCNGFKLPNKEPYKIARGNVTPKVSEIVARDCRDKRSCTFVIKWTEIGDPAYGCKKDFKLEYHCGDNVVRRDSATPEAGNGGTVHMNCQ